MKVIVLTESKLSQEAVTVQDLIDDRIWEPDSDKVKLCKKYMKHLGVSSLNDLMTVSEDDNPSSYKLLNKFVANAKSKDISDHGIKASLYDVNGIKVVAENTYGYYSFYFNRKDLSVLSKEKM